MIGYEIAIDKGVEIMVNSPVLDERLRFAKNWTAQDMTYAYIDNFDFNEQTIRICTNKDEAYALFDEARRECKSGYFWNNHVCFMKFDVLLLNEVEVTLKDDGEYEIEGVIETLLMHISEQEAK